MSKPKYIIPATVKEVQIENDISNYFGYISAKNNKYYRLICTDELKTGSDKVFNSTKGFLLYLQFKASEGLKSIKDYPTSSRKNRSKLEDIREYRDKQKFNDNPTLYFKLRERSKKLSLDYQHNILLKHANQANSQAIYVANLELNKDLYNQKLMHSASSINNPFYWMRHPRIPFHELNYELSMVPFLKEHVSIVPTEKVINAKHYYSYSELGANIVFHSPTIINREISNLGDYLRKLLENLYDRQLELATIDQLSQNLRNNEIEIIDRETQRSGLEYLVEYGKLLNQKYKIKQFIIFDERGRNSR